MNTHTHTHTRSFSGSTLKFLLLFCTSFIFLLLSCNEDIPDEELMKQEEAITRTTMDLNQKNGKKRSTIGRTISMLQSPGNGCSCN